MNRLYEGELWMEGVYGRELRIINGQLWVMNYEWCNRDIIKWKPHEIIPLEPLMALHEKWPYNPLMDLHSLKFDFVFKDHLWHEKLAVTLDNDALYYENNVS